MAQTLIFAGLLWFHRYIFPGMQVNKLSDFDIRIDTLKTQSKVIKGDMLKLDIKNLQYKEAAKYLVTYHKYLPIINTCLSNSKVISSQYSRRKDFAASMKANFWLMNTP